VIDVHTHLGNVSRNRYPDCSPITAEQLLDRMNCQGIDISVLLPLESPEVHRGWFLTEEAVEARDAYPDRFIAFTGIDPRQRCLEEQFELFLHRDGCRGFGELLNPLPFDDDRNRAIYRKCDEYGLPLVFDMDRGQLDDEAGLPRLERCLSEFPNCKFLGHGPGFWTAISGDDTRSGRYEPGPIAPGGAIDRLMDHCENLYLDLSAQSGYNAMTRDPGFTREFVGRRWERMIWGSDFLRTDSQIISVDWFRELGFDDTVVDAIADGNARRLLGLDEGQGDVSLPGH